MADLKENVQCHAQTVTTHREETSERYIQQNISLTSQLNCNETLITPHTDMMSSLSQPLNMPLHLTVGISQPVERVV